MQKVGSSLMVFSCLLTGCTPAAPMKPPVKAPEVLVTKAVLDTITDFEDFTGHTEAKTAIEVKARVTGYLDKVFFNDGDTVKEGDKLFEIDPRPYQVEVQRADAVVVQAESKLKRIELDYQRAVTLRQTNTITKEDFDKVQGDRREAEASVAVARANLEKAKLDLQYTSVTVPNLNNGGKADPQQHRTGRVSRRMKDPGNLIKADDTMLTSVVTLDPMYVYFDVDERTVLNLRSLVAQKKIKSLNEMSFRFELANGDGSLPYYGKINFEDNRLDTGTGTLQLRGVFENSKGLSPGLFVRLRLFLGEPRKAVLVPERALGSDQGQKFLYVIKAETDKDGKTAHKAEYRAGADLRLGALQEVGSLPGRWRVIEKGIQPGDEIIWSGLQRVRKDASVTPKDQLPPGNGKEP